MKALKSIALLVVSTLLLVGVLARAEGPGVNGKMIRLGPADGGTMPALDIHAIGGLVFDTIRQEVMMSDGGVWVPITSGVDSTLAAVFVGQSPPTSAIVYGGDVLPRGFSVSAVTFRISTAGSGGSTSLVWRITDGTNTCDCSIACNAVAGNKSVSCSGSAGSGCSLPTAASLTYSVNSVGDCTSRPHILGNVLVRGRWQ